MRKKLALALFAAAAVCFGTLGAAWACSVQPLVFSASSVNPVTAPVGAEASMRGTAVAADTAVQLRWEGTKGPLLAEVVADGRGEFEMAFTVPDVRPGIYSLVVVAADGGAGVGRIAFEVSGGDNNVFGARATSGFASTDESTGLDAPGDTATSTALVIGVTLLAVGGMVLFAGLAVVTLRRRRVEAPIL